MRRIKKNKTLSKNWYNGEQSPGQQINKFGSLRLASTAGTITGDHEDGSGCLTMLEVDYGFKVSGLCRDGIRPTTDSSSITGVEYLLPRQRLCGTPYPLAWRPPLNYNFRFIRRRAQLTTSIQNHEFQYSSQCLSLPNKGDQRLRKSALNFGSLGTFFLWLTCILHRLASSEVEGIMEPRKSIGCRTGNIAVDEYLII